MIKVMDIKTPNDWQDIYKIKFRFELKKQFKSFVRYAQNIATHDTEGNSGFADKDGNVHRFDSERYDAEFDLPVTERAYQNFIDNECTPVSLMYLWQLCIESFPIVPETESTLYVFIGRDFDDLDKFMDMLTKEIKRQSCFGFNSTNRAKETASALKRKDPISMKCYVHNLNYEFQTCYRNLWNKQFARGKNVFARKARKPMKCHVKYNGVKVEFRDTLVLTQKSLAAWCKDEHLPVSKIKVDQDFYNQIILPNTPLTPDRLEYSIADVVSMCYGLDKYREKYGSLENIPMTQTGSVRRICREKTWGSDKEWCMECADIQRNYNEYIFRQMVHLFMGGWTHANAGAGRVGRTWHHVLCYDFGSSYPACLTTRRYPVSEWYEVDPQCFDQYSSYDIHTSPVRWFAVLKFKNVRSRIYNSYWSLSKCTFKTDDRIYVKNPEVDNGRIRKCDEMCIKMTDVDFDTFRQCYRWDGEPECLELWSAEAGYLSKDLILTILDYFKYKTSLKGVDGAESLYTESKQFINSIYGVAVYRLYSDEIEFNLKGWDKIPDPDHEHFYEVMSKIKDEETFITYGAGIYVTAWARHNLFDLLIPMDERVCYADTDSLKGLFNDKDLEVIEKWNQDLIELENKVADELGFDRSLYEAQTSNGKTKRLGIFEKDSPYVYETFKTLGAKRYVYTVSGDPEVHCTIAGLPKKSGPKKLKTVDDFTNDTMWRTAESGKLMACYNDNQPTTKWTDADGRTYVSDAQYGLCLKPATFNMSLSEDFIHFILAANGDLSDKEFFKDVPQMLL